MEQKDCVFVGSRGILYSCHFHSENPKSSCNNDHGYLLQMLKSNRMFDGMSIYVCSDLLRFFAIRILPQLKHRFILVTGDSDMSVPNEAINVQYFKSLVDNPLLLRWYAQNTFLGKHPKLHHLPIGLDYHTIANNPNHSWKTPGEGDTPKYQESVLRNIIQQAKPFFERQMKIFANFSLHNDRFKERISSLQKIPEGLLHYEKNVVKRTANWNQISNFAFVISPAGNGIDCHRTWEALCLGSIPIIKRKGNFETLFRGLPVLFVNEWSDITETLLRKTIEEFKHRTFQYDKVKLSYWKNEIHK